MASRVNQGKVVSLLSLMVMIFVILGYISYVQLEKSEEIRITDEIVENIDITCMDMFRVDVDFFNYEVRNSEFFKTQNSIYLTQHDSLMKGVFSLVKRAKEKDIFFISPKLTDLDGTMAQYDLVFKKIVEKIKERGYKDYGWEGKLRNYAHDLEKENLLPTTELLTLRRHEKDYLLRNETEYVKKFESLIGQTLFKYKNSSKTIQLIKDYSSSFTNLVNVTEELGFHNQNALKGELNKTTLVILKLMDELSATAEKETSLAYKNGLKVFIISIIVGTIFCFVLIIRIAKKV